MGRSKSTIDRETFKISALANLAAAYNLAITGHILVLLNLAKFPASEIESSAVASSALAGAIIGQFVFGSIGRRIGLEFGLALTLSLCTIGNVVAALLAWKQFLYPVLILCRFVVGIGAGGVYPLSAVASAESAVDEQSRGRRMMLVFSFQGVAQLIAPLSVVLLDFLLPYAPQASWRIALLFGSLPSAFAIPKALRLSALKAEKQSDAEDELLPPELEQETGKKKRDKLRKLQGRCKKRNLMLLLGTAGSWFVFDVVFYGNVIFTPFMLESLFSNIDFSIEKIRLAEFSSIIYILALPGLYLASFYSDYFGRKNIQIIGFTACAVLFFSLAATMHLLSETMMFALYLLSFFFYNFGPNATTFCLPAETFAKEDRSFFNGVSAAVGKMGAVIGASLFKVLLDDYGLRYTFLVCAIICLTGTATTVFFVKDQRGKTMQEIEKEDMFEDAQAFGELDEFDTFETAEDTLRYETPMQMQNGSIQRT